MFTYVKYVYFSSRISSFSYQRTEQCISDIFKFQIKLNKNYSTRRGIKKIFCVGIYKYEIEKWDR